MGGAGVERHHAGFVPLGLIHQGKGGGSAGMGTPVYLGEPVNKPCFMVPVRVSRVGPGAFRDGVPCYRDLDGAAVHDGDYELDGHGRAT